MYRCISYIQTSIPTRQLRERRHRGAGETHSNPIPPLVFRPNLPFPRPRSPAQPQPQPSSPSLLPGSSGAGRSERHMVAHHDRITCLACLVGSGQRPSRTPMVAPPRPALARVAALERGCGARHWRHPFHRCLVALARVAGPVAWHDSPPVTAACRYIIDPAQLRLLLDWRGQEAGAWVAAASARSFTH